MNLTQVYLERALSIHQIRLKHPWMEVLPKNSLIKLIRAFDIQGDFIPGEDDDLKMYFSLSPVNFMYPMFFFNTLLGYAFRSIEGKEFTVKNTYPMIGFTASRAMFSLNQYRGKSGQPLILVEGVSDAEAVSSIYPWVIAVMGNKVKNTMAEILHWYTRKVFLLFDNDKAGQSGIQYSLDSLGTSCKVTPLVYPKDCPYKDPAEMVADGDGDTIKEMIKEAV